MCHMIRNQLKRCQGSRHDRWRNLCDMTVVVCNKWCFVSGFVWRTHWSICLPFYLSAFLSVCLPAYLSPSTDSPDLTAKLKLNSGVIMKTEPSLSKISLYLFYFVLVRLNFRRFFVYKFCYYLVCMHLIRIRLQHRNIEPLTRPKNIAAQVHTHQFFKFQFFNIKLLKWVRSTFTAFTCTLLTLWY